MGKDNSFGALRLLAALMVTLSHSWPLALGSGTPEPPYPLLQFSLGTVGVYIFFAISGILVTRSFVNSTSVARFAWHRFLRIIPALFVCLLISAFVIAPLFGVGFHWLLTGDAYRYIAVNTFLFNGVEAGVSGVFSNNPLPSALNDPIWTLTWEVRAYLILALGAALGVRTKWYGLAAILVCVVLSPLVVNYDGRQPLFLTAFFAGGLLWYVNRNLMHRPLIAAVATLVMIAAHGGPLFDAAFALWIVAIVFALGTIRTKAFLIFEKVDPTYGIYLYSWPIGQMLVSIFGIANPWLLAALTATFATAAATVSWLLVERPAMALKGLSIRPRASREARQG